MAAPPFMPPPDAGPLLPNEEAGLRVLNLNPDDYVALWVHPVPGEAGLTIGSTPSVPATIIQFAGAVPEGTISPNPGSRLILEATSAQNVEIRMYGLRLVVARKHCAVAPVLAPNGWVVKVQVAEEASVATTIALWKAGLPKPVAIVAEDDTPITWTYVTLTLYEAQAIVQALVAAAAAGHLTVTAPPTIEPR